MHIHGAISDANVSAFRSSDNEILAGVELGKEAFLLLVGSGLPQSNPCLWIRSDHVQKGSSFTPVSIPPRPGDMR